MQTHLKLGFTFIEVMIVVGIIGILLGFTILSASKSRNNISIDSALTLLLTDIRNQQLKEMGGNTNLLDTNLPYGVYFEQNRYTIFHSTGYSATDSANFVVNLEAGQRFSDIDLPSSQIVFASSSGEIQNFDPQHNSFTIQDTRTGKQATIALNLLGSVINAQ